MDAAMRISWIVCLCALVVRTHQLDLYEDDQKQRLNIAPKEARTLLRVRRGWGRFRKKINPFEKREEQHEARQAAARNERAREARVLADTLNRECPVLCWTGWGAFGNCSQPCGGGGFATRTRRVKTPPELGRCATWVAQRGCAGNNVQTQACHRFCHNGGTLIATGCTCAEGWTHQCCGTRITCPDPGNPENGATTPNGSGLHYGTSVQFSCNQGYTLQGPSSRTCTGAGTWTNSIPACDIVSCGDPGTPANSDLEVISGAGFVFGSSVRVACRSGYRISGDSVRRCEADGKWTGTAPSCSQIVCADEAKPENGQVVFPSGKTLDSEAQYSCDSGYVLQGAPTRKCQVNGQWTGQQPSCLPTRCSNANAPVYGSVTHSNSANGKTAFAGTAVFSCKAGYSLHGAQSLTCSGTSVQGTWSGRPPVCEAVSCGDPGSPTNGVLKGSNFTFGASVSFMCSAGYFLSGSENAECQADGQWSSAKAQCTECPANEYKEGADSTSSCNACPSHSTTNGATAVTSQVNCICSEGFKGSPGGPCVPITCPQLSVPANAIKKTCANTYNGKCELDCKEGHVVDSGDNIRTCAASGWSGRVLTCSACPVNTYKSAQSQCRACPDNSGTTSPGQEKSGCVCNRGWTGQPGGPCSDVDECQESKGGCAQTCVNEIGTYRCECTDAGWVQDSENTKQCNPKNQCSPMQRPANGGLVCHSLKRTNTERCQVTCNRGFEHLASPNAFEMCGPTTNWQWNHEIEGKPILDCVVSWFEEIVVEVDVFYFTDQCTNLSTLEEVRIAREFARFLNSKGVCKVATNQVCDVGDVRVECAASHKRSTRQKLVISFSLKSMVRSYNELGEGCGASCRATYMERYKTQMQQASQNAQDVIQATIVRPTGSTGEVPSMTLGGIRLQPLEFNAGNVQTLCAKGMVRKNSVCVACPSGSYAVKASDHCLLCPVGSYQPQDGQSLCLPCRTASARGSKSCTA